MSSDSESSGESPSDSGVDAVAECVGGGAADEPAAAEDSESADFPLGLVVRLVGLKRAEFNGHVGRIVAPMSRASGRVGVALHGAVWPEDLRRCSDPIALRPENLRRCSLRADDGAPPSVLGSVPGFAIVRLLGEGGWGLQDTIAEHIAEHLCIRRVDASEITVASCSSYRGDYPISVALNSNEHEWWISGPGSMPDGLGREFLQFDLGPARRRISFVGVRIPPMPQGPLSVRDFHLEVPQSGPRAANGGADEWVEAFVRPLHTLDRTGLQEFALAPPIETDRVRLVCTRTAAAASGVTVFRADCVGLFQVAFA